MPKDVVLTSECNYARGLLNHPLLFVDKLSVAICQRDQEKLIVHETSFTLEKKEICVVIGESGSGKTTLAMAMVGAGLLDPIYRVRGQSQFMGKDLLVTRERDFSKRMGRDIGVILQDPSQALHPLYTIGQQIEEMFLSHSMENEVEWMEKRVEEALDKVDLPKQVAHRFPHEISGGQKQRALIAMATLFSPKLLLCDEPTAALDPTVQNEILRLLLDIREKEEAALFFITHDIKVAKALNDKVMVMHKGKIVESCTREEFSQPKHPYTQHLLSCSPENLLKAGRTRG